MNDYKRRDFIKLSALGFAAVALEIQSISSYARAANGHCGYVAADTELNWDAFLERLNVLAESQHRLPWDQKGYTEQVKRLLLQCNFPEFQNVKKEMEAYQDKRPDWFESASLHYEADFQVSLFQFEKGEYIPHHDHPNMTGVLNLVSGNILAKNYNMEEKLSTTRKVVTDGKATVFQSCTLKEVGSESLTAGSVSILTAEEGNIHSIMPTEFTQLVDVFTPAYKYDTKAKFFTVNEDGFYKERENVFEAEYAVAELSGKIRTVQLEPGILKRYIGRYALDDGRSIEIRLKDDRLLFVLSTAADESSEGKILIPYEENKFWLEDQSARCCFELDDEKRTESVTVFRNGKRIIAKRQ